ncbi:MAG: hypothetical protein R3A10_09245 [Caldilineaceae bacterium]
MLVILTPQDMTRPTQTAELLVSALKQPQYKPVLTSWMGGSRAAAGQNVLNRHNIPTFPYPDTAARVFNYMWQYSYNLRSIYETPSPLAAPLPTSRRRRRWIEEIRRSGQAFHVDGA